MCEDLLETGRTPLKQSKIVTTLITSNTKLKKT